MRSTNFFVVWSGFGVAGKWGQHVGDGHWFKSQMSSYCNCCPLGFWCIAFWARHRTEESKKHQWRNDSVVSFPHKTNLGHLLALVGYASKCIFCAIAKYWHAQYVRRIYCPYFGVCFLQTWCGAPPRLAQSTREDRWLHSRFRVSAAVVVFYAFVSSKYCLLFSWGCGKPSLNATFWMADQNFQSAFGNLGCFFLHMYENTTNMFLFWVASLT